MIRASLKFYGADRDAYGMPNPFHSYFVVSSPWQQEGSGVASVVPLSAGAPLPRANHVIVLEGGPQAALEGMLGVLRTLQANKGLNELVDRD